MKILKELTCSKGNIKIIAAMYDVNSGKVKLI